MKNYVKEYQGRKVPEGAKYYSEDSECFYNENKTKFYNARLDEWCEAGNSDYADKAIELPEAQQEWMPVVGDEIQICFDNVDRESLDDNEVRINGSLVTFIGSLVNGVGQTIFIFDDADNFSDCYPSEYFVKPKTAEEKKREAFIEDAIKLIDTTEFSMGQMDIVYKVINQLAIAGFTAPKAGE